MSVWYKQADNNEIIISSRVRLARNLSGMPFPGRMTAEMFSELKQRVKKAVEEISSDKLPLKYFETDDIPENEINAMVERHIISPDFAVNCKNRALVLSPDESVSIMIGEEDHIRLQVLFAGNSLDEAYALADSLDTRLCEKLDFAYDERLGFLTECPTNIGTGLRASVMLHLPLCESRNEISTIAEAAGKIGLTVRGIYGEGSKSKASMYQLSNQITLGLSEANAIENLKIIAGQIVEREKQSRGAVDRLELEDMVCRALGTLKFARLLNTEELFQLISMIKLGVDEGIIENSIIRPMTMMIEAQPHMLMQRKSIASPRERDEIRAQMIRDILKTD